MMMLLLIFYSGKDVVVGAARLIFIIPEKKDTIQVEEIENDSLYTLENQQKEDSLQTVRIYTIDGFIELKLKEVNKEEICAIAEFMKREESVSKLLKK